MIMNLSSPLYFWCALQFAAHLIKLNSSFFFSSVEFFNCWKCWGWCWELNPKWERKISHRPEFINYCPSELKRATSQPWLLPSIKHEHHMPAVTGSQSSCSSVSFRKTASAVRDPALQFIPRNFKPIFSHVSAQRGITDHHSNGRNSTSFSCTHSANVVGFSVSSSCDVLLFHAFVGEDSGRQCLDVDH